MDSGLGRFPSLAHGRSLPPPSNQPSSKDLVNDLSSVRSLSRFPSLSGTRTHTVTSFSSPPTSQYGDNEHDQLAIDSYLRPRYGLSLYASLPLPPEGDFTRLLCVKPGPPGSPLDCVLFVAEISKYKGRFSALSYVWGRDENTARIFVNGRLVSIRQNLHTFLCALRSPQNRILVWADALCIDQRSNEEKNHQVKLMHKIYISAAYTRAWLGNSMPVLEQAMNNFRNKTNAGQSVSRLEVDSIHLLLPLIEHEYWSRTWIVQEILLAKDVMVHCGRENLCWLDLFRLARDCANQRNASGTLHLKAFGECPMMQLYTSRRNTQSRGLPGLLQKYGRTLCGDIKDRVFGLIGLVDDRNDPLNMEGDVDESHRANYVINYAISTKELFFRLLPLYHSLPVHHFALPLWKALELNYCDFDAADLSRTLQIQGFPCSRLTARKAHVRTLTHAAENMSLDDTTQEELLSFSSPGDMAFTYHSKVCLSIRVRINDFELSEYYLASACMIEPRRLVLGRHGYDLLCQAFDGACIHRQIEDQSTASAWLIEITVAALKALNAITNPTEHQHFLDSIQIEQLDDNTSVIDADILEWVTAVRRPPDLDLMTVTRRINFDALLPEPISKNLLLAEKTKPTATTLRTDVKSPAVPAVIDRGKTRHKIMKGAHLTKIYDWLTKPLYGDAQFRYK